jgi:hypothetical protein
MILKKKTAASTTVRIQGKKPLPAALKNRSFLGWQLYQRD